MSVKQCLNYENGGWKNCFRLRIASFNGKKTTLLRFKTTKGDVKNQKSFSIFFDGPHMYNFGKIVGFLH